MIYALILLCLASIGLQAAILRDRSITEHHLIERMRYIRIVAYAIGGLSATYLVTVGYWIQWVLGIPLALVAFADCVGAFCRLFPDALPHDFPPPDSRSPGAAVR
jgi:hypothetical protein